MVQNLKKLLKSKIFKFFSFLRHEVPFKAKNNREAVVVCAIHVVKRPSKRSVLVYNKMVNANTNNFKAVFLVLYFLSFSQLLSYTQRQLI